MNIKVLKAGLQDTIQDAGRRLSQQDAVASAGVMDDYAFRWANALLANPLHAPVIEVTGGGAHWQIEQAGLLALTGADLDAHLNHKPITPWQSFRVDAGDQLVFNGPKFGYRAYIACAGGWQTKGFYDACACALREKPSGGFGHWIQTGDRLSANLGIMASSITSSIQPKIISPRYQPNYSVLRLPIISCHQTKGFDPTAYQAWLAKPMQVQSASDRMGIRLRGDQPVAWQHPAPLSEPTTQGAVQMTPAGEVLVLMADRQTLGGYPKLGHISWWGRSLLAQAKPFSTIHWVPTELKTAKQLQTHWYQFWQGFISN